MFVHEQSGQMLTRYNVSKGEIGLTLFSLNLSGYAVAVLEPEADYVLHVTTDGRHPRFGERSQLTDLMTK